MGHSVYFLIIGDIIIEANARPVRSPHDLKLLLPVHSRVVPLTYIPVGKPQSPVTPDKSTNGKPAGDGSRVKRAKDLHVRVCLYI